MPPEPRPFPVEPVELSYAGSGEPTASTWPGLFWVAFHCWWIPSFVFTCGLVTMVVLHVQQARKPVGVSFLLGMLAALVGLRCLANYRDCVVWLDPKFRVVHEQRIRWLRVLLWLNLLGPVVLLVVSITVIFLTAL